MQDGKPATQTTEIRGWRDDAIVEILRRIKFYADPDLKDESLCTEDGFSLYIQKGKAGLWYITGSVPGLFIAAPDLEGALGDVPAALAKLVNAKERADAK